MDPGNSHNCLARSCWEGVNNDRELSRPGGKGFFLDEKGEVMMELTELSTLRMGPSDCVFLDGDNEVDFFLLGGVVSFFSSSAAGAGVEAAEPPLVFAMATSKMAAATATSCSSAGAGFSSNPEGGVTSAATAAGAGVQIGASSPKSWENLHSSPNLHLPSLKNLHVVFGSMGTAGFFFPRLAPPPFFLLFFRAIASSSLYSISMVSVSKEPAKISQLSSIQ